MCRVPFGMKNSTLPNGHVVTATPRRVSAPKFLIGCDGEVIKRYEPPVPPADIKADLENYL